jgi:hypothetical protein
MYHKLLLPFFILIFSNYYSYAQLIDTVKNPAEDYVKSFENDSLLQNPSMHNICKITADFNSDGIKDIAISDSYLCGAHACYWNIYLGLGDTKYKYFSTLWFHNYAIKIDSVADGISNIYIYDKAGGGVGDIIEYNLSSSNGINEINRKTIYPESYPENEDYKYYKNIFTQTALIDSCINILDYLKTNKLNWKSGYY